MNDIGETISQIERRRRLSVQDDWPECGLCDKPFTSGFTIWAGEDRLVSLKIHVCDSCLGKAKKSKIGFHPESRQ